VPSSDHRIGYVCKMYPRFSETFIVSEILAREAAGEHIEVVSLRTPAEGRFHASLAAVQAPVTYLEPGSPRSKELWDRLRRISQRPPAVDLAPLLKVPVREAAQAIELSELIEQRGLTHLHAHFASVSTTVARLAARLAGITYSFTAHAKDIFHEDVDPVELRAKLADAAHVVTVSEYNLRYLTERYGTAAATVRRIYNGIQLEAFPMGDATRPRPVDVVAVGRLVEKKGFEVLVDACAIARDRGTPLRARIVGTGDREASLRSRVREAGLESDVEFTGALPQDRVRAEIRDAAAMAAPCVVGRDGNADGLPTVILEAMALGTPVVSTPVTGIPEAVIDRHTGRLVAEHDPVGLADALTELQADQAQRNRLAASARTLVETEFSSTRQAEQLRELLPARETLRRAVA
jgi:colanic acid/amylovoran biosynthesis glycosyltransferase